MDYLTCCPPTIVNASAEGSIRAINTKSETLPKLYHSAVVFRSAVSRDFRSRKRFGKNSRNAAAQVSITKLVKLCKSSTYPMKRPSDVDTSGSTYILSGSLIAHSELLRNKVPYMPSGTIFQVGYRTYKSFQDFAVVLRFVLTGSSCVFLAPYLVAHCRMQPFLLA